MEAETVLSRLTQVFRTVLRSPELDLNSSISAGEIDGWDSLNHVVLISAIEEHFGIKFKLKELMNIESVGDMMRMITEKTSSNVS